MITANWKDLLISRKAMQALPQDELDAVSRASDDYLHTLAHGVSGLGNLLACTASNGETGLSADAVTSIGWMLDSLGGLISNLSDTSTEADQQISERKPNTRKAASECVTTKVS